jgi:hypothetical protein
VSSAPHRSFTSPRRGRTDDIVECRDTAWTKSFASIRPSVREAVKWRSGVVDWTSAKRCHLQRKGGCKGGSTMSTQIASPLRGWCQVTGLCLLPGHHPRSGEADVQAMRGRLYLHPQRGRRSRPHLTMLSAPLRGGLCLPPGHHPRSGEVDVPALDKVEAVHFHFSAFSAST